MKILCAINNKGRQKVRLSRSFITYRDFTLVKNRMEMFHAYKVLMFKLLLSTKKVNNKVFLSFVVFFHVMSITFDVELLFNLI